MEGFFLGLADVAGLPALVRKLIATLSAFVIFVMPTTVYTAQQNTDTYMLPGDEVFSYESGENWTVGFAKSIVTPKDVTADTYYIAGYYSNNPATGVLDDMYARAVYLDDNTGRGGVVICAIDCVGLSRHDINEIRKLVIESGKIPAEELKSINIASTHAHSAIDTQGLWGSDFYKDGKNAGYMEYLKDKTARTIINAYKNRCDGNLYIGEAATEDMQTDCRTPIDYSNVLTRIRFSPSDGSKDTYIINYACHAELLGKKNSLVSADFPAYLGREIERQTNGANFLFINGANGGMISAKEIDKVYDDDSFDCLSYTIEYGTQLGRAAMSISNEEQIAPLVNINSQGVSIYCDNTMLTVARFITVLDNDVERSEDGESAYILSEISYMELGDEQVAMFLIPGELYPELMSGNFMPAEDSATGLDADYTPLSAMSDCKYEFVVGLCNDELGYIIPDNDYLLHDWLPYFNIPKDEDMREHYEETNSTGPETARTLLDKTQDIIFTVKP